MLVFPCTCILAFWLASSVVYMILIHLALKREYSRITLQLTAIFVLASMYKSSRHMHQRTEYQGPFAYHITRTIYALQRTTNPFCIATYTNNYTNALKCQDANFGITGGTTGGHYHFIAMAWCKRDATPVRQQWSYLSFALSHWYVPPPEYASLHYNDSTWASWCIKSLAN